MDDTNEGWPLLVQNILRKEPECFSVCGGCGGCYYHCLLKTSMTSSGQGCIPRA